MNDVSVNVETRPLLRRLGRALAVASHGQSVDALDAPAIELARLQAGIDPESVDPHSAAFRLGAIEAYSTVINALSEQMLSRSAMDMLRKASRSRLLAAIAGNPGVVQKTLSDRAQVKESNLSKYVRQLADAGLIEATHPEEGRGKAWRLSPWGVQTLFQASDVISAHVQPEDFTAALQGAIEIRGRGSVVPQTDYVTLIPKDEVYRRLQEAMETRNDEPLRVTTFYRDDLRLHKRAWPLHKKFVTETNRPIEWILRRDDLTKSWVDELVEMAIGNTCVTIYELDNIADPGPTVQVLDNDGLQYPVSRDGDAIVRPKDEAYEEWLSYREGAAELLVKGELVHS